MTLQVIKLFMFLSYNSQSYHLSHLLQNLSHLLLYTEIEQDLAFMSTEYIHVTQFLETIFCFSILVLIGQRFIMTCKGEDQKYLQHRLRQLEQQILWQRQHQKQPVVQMQPSPQNHAQPQMQESFQMQYPQQAQPEYPQQPTLRTSLNDNQNDQTARKMSDQQPAQEKVQPKRKSLTDLVKQSQQSKTKQVQIKEVSDSVSIRQPSMDSRQGSDRNRGITNELDRSHIMNENLMYPPLSVSPNNSDINQQFKAQAQSEMKLQIFTLIDTAFNEHFSVLMSMLVLGILTESTFITSMISFFGYFLTHLLLKLKQSIEKIDDQPENASKLSAFYPLLPKLWIFVLFINYWAVTEYSL